MKTNVSKTISDFFIIDFLFFETEEVILRLLNALIICENKFDQPFKIMTEENTAKVIQICKSILANPIDCDSKRLFAKRVLINLFSREKDNFYDDYLVELNLTEHKGVKHDYDIVFLHGLNVKLYLFRLISVKAGELMILI